VQALAIGREEAARIGSEAGTFRAAVAETEMLSEAVPEDPAVTTVRARGPAAAAFLEHGIKRGGAAVVAVGDAGEGPKSRKEVIGTYI